MAENKVTPEQLQNANEPAFSAAAAARQDAQTREAQVPGEFRGVEAGVHDQAHAAAAQSIAQGLGDMHGSRTARMTGVAAQQATTRDANAAERARVTQELERIKTTTRNDVQSILDTMQTTAGEMFEAGLARAETRYEDVFAEAKGGAYKWLTTWGDDWKAHLEQSFKTARAAYDAEVSQAIDLVAAYVEGKLAEAKLRVKDGRAEADRFVAGLDANVAQFGRDANAGIAGDFDAMAGDIDQRSDQLVAGLAQQYSQSLARVAETEKKLRENNKNIWEKVYDATVGVIDSIVKFKDMLLGVLARAASVVESIMADPIGFLGNLIAGVKAGFDRFSANIGRHLEEGLMGWLFGVMEGAGLKLPKQFDFEGILSLILQVLGLTPENVRKRAVTILGAETVKNLEEAGGIFVKLVTEGPAALWEMLLEKLGSIKDSILEQIQAWVTKEVIEGGIMWLLSLFNPVAAFIKACIGIYDLVMFFIERAKQIAALINAIIDSLAAIVSGNLDKMAQAVEDALARGLTFAIGLLASLLHLGGISDTISNIIKSIQKPVNAAIDWVIHKAVALVKKVGKLFGGKKSKDKEEKEPADPEKQAKVDAAMLDLDTNEKQAAATGKSVTQEEAVAIAEGVQQRHPVIKSIKVEHGEGVWRYLYHASPEEVHSGNEPAAPPTRPPELEGESTPYLELLQKEPGYEDVAFTYVADHPKYIPKKERWPLIRYVEHRAGTKLGNLAEKPGIAAYNEETGSTVSKNSQAFELLAGDPPNFTRESVRIPDFYEPGVVVGDVKNVKTLSYDKQMQDDVRIARADRVRLLNTTALLEGRLRFDLVVKAPTHDLPEGTHVTGPLGDAVEGVGLQSDIYRLI